MDKKKKTILIALLSGAVGGGTGPYAAKLLNGGRLCVGLTAAFIAAILALILSIILKEK